MTPRISQSEFNELVEDFGVEEAMEFVRSTYGLPAWEVVDQQEPPPDEEGGTEEEG